MVEEIIDVYKKNLGQRLLSIYVGGSVALGAAVIGKSDVDTYAIVDVPKEKLEDEYEKWVDSERKRLDRRYPFQRGVEIHLISKDAISEGKKFQIKYTSACVYGIDLSKDYPEYPITRETFALIRVSIYKDIQYALDDLSKTDDPVEISRIGTWISKRLIRSFGVMVLWKENVYTMDIEPIVKILIRYYPNKKKEIETLLHYSKSAPSDKDIIKNMLNSTGKWLIEEDAEIFG